ncbi:MULTISPECIES: hypothetical protein [Neisseriaceae]|uniref:Uncharacterized protein n=1 Tax=Alysiella crassa TaxID=153491 RepID=A0A376BLZ9_9NEIS|nr:MULTISPECIES: hypothetical protein [Neisseriaceae]ULJ69353.1 hypothetical protein MIS45_00250 [Wielerella bovis]UOP07173.1 hypothetical protein LVJ80_01540 [Alysiella crassa]SSY70665.1 Uncharacterised protein [Alysiella crassa]
MDKDENGFGIILGFAIALSIIVSLIAWITPSQKEVEIIEKCQLIKQDISVRKSHYRCADGVEYILNRLPKQEKP